MNTTLEARTLTALDRCDSCGAQAYVRFSLHSGGDLLFCAHHARAHEDALSSVATIAADDRENLAV